jgi:predicted nucleotidyltransferase
LSRQPTKKQSHLFDQAIPDQRQELERRYHVSSLGLFGSRLLGNYKEDSDLDVLVTFFRSLGLLQFSGLQYHLSDLLGARSIWLCEML